MLRLDDEVPAQDDSVVFSAHGQVVEIVAGGTTELLDATVAHEGRARLPYAVFRGVGRALRFYRARGSASVVLIPGRLRIGTTEYRNPSIAVDSLNPEDSIAAGKPAKLQNR